MIIEHNTFLYNGFSIKMYAANQNTRNTYVDHNILEIYDLVLEIEIIEVQQLSYLL